MICYYVWFSFQPNVPPAEGLPRVREFLDAMVQRGWVVNFKLLCNRDAAADPARAFQAAIDFVDDAAFAAGFATVEHEGVRAGLHGLMVDVIKDFAAESFEGVDRV
jgi:hypothetical protein